ncbi:hypothetical protein J5N97_020404 [Dioscorea zingiberensis]|uniref:Protein kinase domain-containing protein n=1 Tax=Dioscorea zingiberensis TaxID=325984 RepID=A0A9D5CHY4_9LILI|nr:hypothetical protein J5N97_020404 [Dioscorea zingiberensis]
MGMGKWRKREGGVQVEEKTVVLVAVGGNKEITDYALEWAVRNVVQPEDTLILLALVSMPPTNIQSAVPQFFSSLFKKWGNGSGQSNNESSVVESGKTMQDDEIGRVNEICAEMMNELCSQNSIKHVQTQVKLIPQSQLGAVADSAEEHQAKWVILDRTFRSDGTMMVQERSSSTMRTRPSTMDRTSSIRRDISLSIKQPHNPPPLCSVCKHAAPMFGKPPRKFSYEEMAKATNGFSSGNYLSEGGFGPVYRGVLEDGQVVAVKKHRKVSAQGAAEFCSEVEVLSCAQHRNLVMLVGYCMDDDWLLVYEFACNGSLDKHLYGQYLAPEYTQTGQITEKADVYAFGVLLLELISGVKAIDLARGSSIDGDEHDSRAD